VLLPTSRPEPDLRSATLLAWLHARGLRARLGVSECSGERDLRIRAQRRRFGPSVELLCCTAGDPQPPQWHAVRLLGSARTVWRGPGYDGELDAVVGFVEDLLVLDDTALAERYRRLG